MSFEYLEYLISAYGYYALFIGTCLEGETIMLLGGIAAEQEHMMKLRYVILVGFLGSLTGDQAIFFVSRFWGRRIISWAISQFPSWQPRIEKTWRPRIEKISRLLERHSTWYILSFRFFYGLRNPTPVVIGISSVPTAKFVALNMLGAMVWAVTVGCLGYVFGMAAENLVKDVKWAILAVAGAAVLVWVVRHAWLRYRRRAARPPEGQA